MRILGMLVVTALVIGAAGTAQRRSAPRLRNAPDYFPLAAGNAWIYLGGGVYAGATLTLEITQTQMFNGNRYFLLHGFPQQDYWVRQSAGSVLAYDPVQAVEKTWWDFQSPLGQPYPTSLPGVCCGDAEVMSRSAAYKGLMGEFTDALEISYPGVFQVGIARECFLPGVGLAFRSQATGGPSTGSWELLYARLGGVTVHAAKELSFGLTLDNSIYTADMMPPVQLPAAAPLMSARLTLRNTGQPIALTFPSGQSFDLEVRNDKGTVVYRWSDGQAFIQVFRSEIFGPGEKNFVVQVRLLGPDKNPLPKGKYLVEAWLTTQDGKTYDATTGFEIRWVF